MLRCPTAAQSGKLLTGAHLAPVCTHLLVRHAPYTRTRIISTHRRFSWGSRHKWGTPKGKMYHDKARKIMLARVALRYPYFERQMLRQCLPGQGWRSASSWRDPTGSRQKQDQGSDMGQEDWYTKWERQRRLRYEEFVKKIEEDPFAALFGRSNRWLGWVKDECGVPENVKEQVQHMQTSSQQTSSNRRESPAPTNPKDATNYDIDPLTLRKIPRYQSTDTVSSCPQTQRVDKKHVIPVKVFKASQTSNIAPKHEPSTPKHAETARHNDWLISEGFKAEGKPVAARKDSKSAIDTTDQARDSKIQTALDRHLEQDRNNSFETKRGLRYEAKENRTEDVDLLRASDIRASAGTRGRKVESDPVKKAHRHGELETRFSKGPIEIEQRLQDELATSGYTGHLQSGKQQNLTPLSDLDAQYMNKISDTSSSATGNVDESHPLTPVDKGIDNISSEMSRKSESYSTKMVPLKMQIDLMRLEYDSLKNQWLVEARRLKARKAQKLLQDEVTAQKSAMETMELPRMNLPAGNADQGSVGADVLRGEGDVASNVHEFTNRAKWYKRKAPHAKDDVGAKYEQKTRDKALVNEIRQIYEDSYGAINTKHRQPLMADAVNGSDRADRHTLLKEDPWATLLGSSSREVEKSGHSERRVYGSRGDMEKARDLINEVAAELRQIDELLKARIEDPTEPSSTSKAVKSAAYKQHMSRVLDIASKIAHATPSIREELFECISSAAKLSWTANTLLLESSLAFPRLQTPQNVTPSSPTEPTPRVVDQAPDTTSVPTTYRILAYDDSTQRLTSAKTTSLAPFDNEQPMKPLDALTTLTNPGKFLPQLMSLHNKGYDIIAGKPNILVLKKVRQSHLQPSNSLEDPKYGDEAYRTRQYRANPIDGTMSSTGNYASPTGFVNHDSILTEEELTELINEQKQDQEEEAARLNTNLKSKESLAGESASSSNPEQINPSRSAKQDHQRVRREEAVFSGSRRRGGWQVQGASHHHGGKRFGGRRDRNFNRRGRKERVVRRVLLTGAVSAAFCYAVGVWLEAMKV